MIQGKDTTLFHGATSDLFTYIKAHVVHKKKNIINIGQAIRYKVHRSN